MEKRALVLGGGGVTGVAWTVGLIHGLAERGLDLTTADLFVGTSAGSVVAAQLTGGRTVDDLYRRELADTSGDRNAAIGVGVIAGFVVAAWWPGGRAKGRAWLGRAALRKKTVPEHVRSRAIAERIEREDWPVQQLKIPAVEAVSGAVEVFTNDSGVSLVDAVAASCAVPLVWPPMTVRGKRYVDGGVRSVANVDLAAGYDRVVVIAPTTASARRSDDPRVQARRFPRSTVVTPTDAALTAIGRNPLDPSRRAPAAAAGEKQAAAAAAAVERVWRA